MSNAADSKRGRSRRIRAGQCLACRFPTHGYAYCGPCRLERAEKMRAYHQRRRNER